MININPRRDFRAESAVVLGSTGSVGTQALDVIRENGIKVKFLSAGKNVELLAEQIKEFKPELVSVADRECAKRLLSILGGDMPETIFDEDEIFDAIRETDADIIFHSVSGLSGIGYALAAAESGKRIGLANKEAVIALGDVIFEKARKSGSEIIPVDSEHSAIFRCLEGHDIKDVSRILLTASGGPFFGKSREELGGVTLDDTLAHPTWNMGAKITVDSATLMNKGFEIIEAVRLFGLAEDRVDVVVHRQSIVHSMIEMNDCTLFAQMGKPDMRDCVRYSLSAPHFLKTGERLSLSKIGSLTFAEPDCKAFPLLDAAREAIRQGGTAPAALIAADEEAVDAFLKRKIGFLQISDTVLAAMEKINNTYELTEESVSSAVLDARRITRDILA